MENCQENLRLRVNVIFLLTDFTPGGLVTEYTVSQNSPNRIALKISTFLFTEVSKVFYHARPVLGRWQVQLATTVCKFWRRLYHARLPFLKQGSISTENTNIFTLYSKTLNCSEHVLDACKNETLEMFTLDRRVTVP